MQARASLEGSNDTHALLMCMHTIKSPRNRAETLLGVERLVIVL